MTTPSSADLTNLFQAPAGRESYRQGTILTFNPATGANTVQVGGAVLANLPILIGGDTVNLDAGDAVVLLRYASSWAILGRIVIPGNEALQSTAVDFYAASANADDPGAPGLNFAVTTSFISGAIVTVDTPTWANSALIQAVGRHVVQNTTGASNMLRSIVDINGAGGGESFDVIPAGTWGTGMAAVTRELTVGGGGPFELLATTGVENRVRIDSGADWNCQDSYLNVSVIFRKVA